MKSKAKNRHMDNLKSMKSGPQEFDVNFVRWLMSRLVRHFPLLFSINAEDV